MKKTLILDTSLIVKNPKCFEKIKNQEIIIPIYVLEELDKLKTYRTEEVAKNARFVTRYLDELSSTGKLHEGIKLPNKSILIVDTNEYTPVGEDKSYNDNKILSCGLFYSKNKKKKNVTILSADINMRVRARALGLEAGDFIDEDNDQTLTDDFYSGVSIIQDEDLLQDLMEKNCLNLNEYKNLKFELNPNECVIFQDENGYDAAIGRKISNEKIKVVRYPTCWGISPKSKEQALAMDMILDPNLPLTSIIGKAGSGKTIISLASCLELVLEKKKYNKLVIYRPIEVVGGKELGFMPGNKYEKMEPYFGAIFDAFEALFSKDTTGRSSKSKGSSREYSWRDTLEMLIEKGVIEFDVISFARGRSISNALLLIDEAQNMSPHEAKTMLTRIGNGTKVVINGDIEQIDSKALDINCNAVSTIVNTFKKSSLAGHITLQKCERSPLANEAIKLL